MSDEEVPPESKPDVSLFLSLHLGDLMKETGHLSPAEMGAHMRLVMAAWSRDGYLPGDALRLRRLAGVDSADWEAIWDAIAELWQQDEAGRWYSPTVVERVRKAKDAKLRAVARGRAGGTAPHPTQRREQVETGSRASREQVDGSSTSSRDEDRDGGEIEPSLRTPDSGLRTPDSGTGLSSLSARDLSGTDADAGVLTERWYGAFKAEWWKSKGRHYGQGMADTKAKVRLTELLSGLDQAERTSGWDQRGRFFSEFFAKADGPTAGAGWSFSFFVAAFNGLRIPPEKRPPVRRGSGQAPVVAKDW